MKTSFSPFSPLAHALSGVQTNLRGLDRSAHEIASAQAERVEPVELIDPLVDSIVQQRALEASASVIRRVDEALGTLIDTFA